MKTKTPKINPLAHLSLAISFIPRNLNVMGVLSIALVTNIVTPKPTHALTFTGTPLTLDFTGFTGAGFAPSPASGQLSSNDFSITGLSDGSLAFGGTGTSGDFARGSSMGSETTGGIYSFDTGGGNPSLGVQPSADDFTSGTITLQITNNTGSTLTSVMVGYNLLVNNDEGRANSFNFSFATGTDNTPGSFTNVGALDFTSTETADGSGFQSNPRSTILSSISIADGDELFLRWTSADVSGSGSRDEFALDDITMGTVNVPFELSPGIGILALVATIGVHKLTQHKN